MAEVLSSFMRVLQNASKEASSRRSEQIEPLHILLALLWEWDSPAFETLSLLGVPAGSLRHQITQKLGSEQVHPMLGLPASASTTQVIHAAFKEAHALQEEKLAPSIYCSDSCR